MNRKLLSRIYWVVACVIYFLAISETSASALSQRCGDFLAWTKFVIQNHEIKLNAPIKPIPGVIDAVSVGLEKNGKILLGKRAFRPSDPLSNKWTVLGGKIDRHESIADASRREFREESGIDVDRFELIHTFFARFPGGIRYRVFVVAAHESKGETQILEPDKIAELKWFSLEELPSPLTESSIIFRNWLFKKSQN